MKRFASWRQSLWAALAILLLSILYWSLKASLGGHERGGWHSRTYMLSISVPRLGEEPTVFKAMQGDTVTLMIRSDRPGEVHIHGYEKRVVLEPGVEVSLSFRATDAGLFAIHLHDPDGSMHGLAILEVQPR